MSDLRVVIVGCGAAGGVHLQCWRNLSGVRVSAVCDTNGVTAAQLAATAPGVAAFQDLKVLLKAGDIDIVDICAPAASQFEVARTALNAGAHVLCETPFTLNADQADTLIRLAESRERHLAPAFCHRLHPPVIFAHELVENDELGRITMFRSRFSGYWDDAATDAGAGAAGALRSSAIHGIDLFRYFCGDVKDVTGKLKQTNPELKVEDTVALLLESVSGAIGVVETCWSSPGGRTSLEIYGTAGACVIDYDTGTLRYLTADQPIWRHHDEGGPNRFERIVAGFADVVRGLQVPTASAADGAAALAVCDRVTG